jgi:hypothetical protein
VFTAPCTLLCLPERASAGLRRLRSNGPAMAAHRKRLLRGIRRWGLTWEPPAAAAPGEQLDPDPASSAQAVLLLLSRLTRSHSCALRVLAAKGPRLVLDLPSTCFLPENEPFMSAIMRHILEDPSTLQVRGAGGRRTDGPGGHRGLGVAAVPLGLGVVLESTSAVWPWCCLLGCREPNGLLGCREPNGRPLRTSHVRRLLCSWHRKGLCNKEKKGGGATHTNGHVLFIGRHAHD